MSGAALPVTWLRLPPRDLEAVFAAWPETHRFYLEGGAGRGPRAVLGLGEALRLEAEGDAPLAALGRALAAARGRIAPRGDAAAFGGAVFVGGAAFDGGAPAGADPAWAGLPAGRLVLPRVLALAEPDGLRVAVAGEADAAAARARAEAWLAPPARPVRAGAAGAGTARIVPEGSGAAYRTRVARALEAIAAGRLEKVVVARRCRLEADAPLDVARALARLRTDGAARRFALAWGARTFLGATPERLLRVAGGRAEVDAIAGTHPRAPGGADDAVRARRLRESKKDQEEHAIVVRAVRAALAGPCEGVRAPEAPGVLAAGDVLHLHTPFEARIAAPDTGLLELAARLHPTPAVGGAGRAEARAWLRAHEGLARGWYAGPLGVVGLDGSGELRVALRCALVRDRTAWLYAGAGVVRGSEPEAELEETRVKLRPALGALLEI